jgi:hypothetical protein
MPHEVGVQRARPQTVHLRAVGAATGFKVRLPQTWDGLLHVARRLILNGSRPVHVFRRHGDRVAGFDAIHSGEVLYVSADGTWVRPPVTAGGREPATHASTDDAQYRQSSEQERVAPRRRRVAHAAGGVAVPSGDHTRLATPLLASLLLSSELVATPHRLTRELPARLCAGKPPWVRWPAANEHCSNAACTPPNACVPRDSNARAVFAGPTW